LLPTQDARQSRARPTSRGPSRPLPIRRSVFARVSVDLPISTRC